MCECGGSCLFYRIVGSTPIDPIICGADDIIFLFKVLFRNVSTWLVQVVGLTMVILIILPLLRSIGTMTLVPSKWIVWRAAFICCARFDIYSYSVGVYLLSYTDPPEWSSFSGTILLIFLWAVNFVSISCFFSTLSIGSMGSFISGRNALDIGFFSTVLNFVVWCSPYVVVRISVKK